MKIITCASYYGSGSSAVTDFISEFVSVKSMTNYEFRFAHDPDGISELEYNLVENFNRHNSGHALKRYQKMVKYYGKHLLVKRYEPFFDNKWEFYSNQYIQSLIDFSYPGVWQYDFYDKGRLYEFFAKLPDRILSRTIWRHKPDKHLFFGKNVTYASNPGEEKFLECTKKYTSNLFKAANKDNYKFFMVDQILPSSNLERHMRYFDNLVVFLVDRDPRDVYLLAKYVWNDSIVPRDINLFCKWFKYVRSTQQKEINTKGVFYIKFEDLIYKYDDTTKKIMDTLGLTEEEHISKCKFFNPKLSIKNTRLWINNPEYEIEAKQIEELLPEYLYDFPGGQNEI